jgi:hypothetical protein
MAGSAYLIDTSFSLFSLSYTTGVITVNSMTPNDKELLSNTGTWNIIFSCEHIFEPYYKLFITFPLELKVQQLAGCNLLALDNF